MPVLDAFIISKMLPIKWNFCRKSGYGLLQWYD